MTGADVCSHVKVVVRVRPENTRELEGNFRKVVQVVDSRMLVFDPKEAEDVSFFQAQRIRNRDINKKANKDLKFVFDHVFAENAAQLDVFENSTKSILESVLNGYNCTVFAYGATGAGKTHTMLGCENDPGVMYLTMKELFSRIEQVREEKEFEVAFSYLEVYNEQIRDLLANAGPLAVREDSAKGVVVQGLTLHRPKSAEHILEALDYGNRNRTQHPTDVNASSSRSHAVFQIYLRQQERSASLNPNIRVAKMSLIDLAGSERASATNAKGARFREGANINRSLLALGNVINALADPKSKKGHIPYRDSKLTRLLKDSLGGNCRTIMIANVSSSSASYEDTYNTLKYANRAKEIKSTLKSNVVSLDSHISQYAVICEKQRAEIQMLKEKLKQYEEKKVAAPSTNPSLLQKEAECKKMAESLQSVFSSRIQIRKECLSLERALKEIEMRRRCREECHQQTQLLCGEDKTEKATCKHERRLASLLAQQQHVERKLQDAQQRLLENEGWLHRLENEMKLFGEGGQAPQSLRRDLHCHKLQLQVEDLRQHVEHMTHLVSLQDQEHRHSKKIIDALLPAFLRHYTTIMSSGLASSSDESQYQAMQQLVQKERGVVWADQAVEVSEQSEVVSGQQELTSLLRFSHVVCHQSTPCSSEKQRKRTSLGQQPASLVKGPSGEVGKENSRSCQHQETPSMKQTRRKLAISPQRSMPLSTLGLQEALRQEGMFPLQYTPEGRGGGDGPDPNITIDVEPSTINNATILISPAVCSQHALSKPFKRLEIPLLREEKRGKPSYMAMTSAAQRKRKLDSSEPSSSREPFRDNLQGAVEPKRVRQDSVAGGNKPMRVRRMRGLQEEGASRRVVRSVSEGNIDLLGVRKPKSSFLKSTQLFKRVTKRL